MTGKAISYTLTLTAPLMLSVPAGDENSATTLSYVSGSSVLGALATRWLGTNSTPRPEEDPEFRALFLDGTARYLNAYPKGQSSLRLLPPPLSLYQEKNQDNAVFDLAGRAREEPLADEYGKPLTLTKWNKGFVSFFHREGSIKHRAADQITRLHNQRDREKGRPTPESGAIFSYISLAAGERFRGVVLVEKEEHASRIESMLNQGPLSFGKSRSAQYGGNAEVENIEIQEVDAFCEEGTISFQRRGRVVLSLTSDYLGLDKYGQFAPGFFLQDFADSAGVERSDLEVVQRFCQVRLVSGYVSVWRMPRPVRPALLAGSVFVLGMKRGMDDGRLAKLLWRGLGQRTAEGFGRVVVNWHAVPEDEDNEELLKYAPEQETKDRVLPGASSRENYCARQSQIVSLCRTRLLSNAIEDALPGIVAGIIPHSAYLPSKAVLGRVRSRLRVAREAEDITAFLLDCNDKKAGKDLSQCKIGSWPLYEWLYKIFEPGDFIDGQIGLKDLAKNNHLDGVHNANAAFDSGVKWIYQRRLADLVLQELVRHKTEQETAGDE